MIDEGKLKGKTTTVTDSKPPVGPEKNVPTGNSPQGSASTKKAIAAAPASAKKNVKNKKGAQKPTETDKEAPKAEDSSATGGKKAGPKASADPKKIKDPKAGAAGNKSAADKKIPAIAGAKKDANA